VALLLGFAAPAGIALLPAGASLTAPAEVLVRAALQAGGASGEFQIVGDQPVLPLFVITPLKCGARSRFDIDTFRALTLRHRRL
jgi:hypothetical protein